MFCVGAGIPFGMLSIYSINSKYSNQHVLYLRLEIKSLKQLSSLGDVCELPLSIRELWLGSIRVMSIGI